MNALSDISDEEFVPFLHSLGVETYKKSFEWMLNDTDFASVLRWLYNNLNYNNALSAREEYRYTEIEKKGEAPSPEELEKYIVGIQEEYPGICLPGNQEDVGDVKLHIKMQKDRLNLLENQEVVIADLIRQNELINEELNLELARLSSAQQQSTEDQTAAADECISLAEDVETFTEEVIDVIADNLELYGNCLTDKETAKRFYTFGPFEAYRHSQALFRSHFDLYVSKNLTNKQNDITDEDLRSALIEAKSMEGRLSDATLAFIESKAELSGEQAKLALVSNYNNVHPSQITSCLLEAQSALELLEQEECILEQQTQNGVKQFVQSRTSLAVDTTAKAALAVRQQIHNSLTHLVNSWERALSLDRLLYCALRHELRTLQEFLQFAAHLRQYTLGEGDAVSARIDSMNAICAEQESCERKLQSSDVLLHSLYTVLGAQPSADGLPLMKLYNDLQSNIKDLNDCVNEGYTRKEKSLHDFKKSSKQLMEYIWDGCTKQPNCVDRTVAALSHSLRQELEILDKKVVEASSLFGSVKNGDKQNLRKLWQWFLTDPARLLAAMKTSRSYS